MVLFVNFAEGNIVKMNDVARSGVVNGARQRAQYLTATFP